MPGSFGVKKARPFPVHSRVAGTVCCGSFCRSARRHLQRFGNQARQVQAVCRGVDGRRAGKVLANEKGVDRRHPAIEVFDRSLQILGTVVVQDHGPLAGDRGAVRALDLSGCRRGQKRSEDLTPVCLHRSYSLIYRDGARKRRPRKRRYRVSVTLVSVRGLSGSRPLCAARQAAKICAGTTYGIGVRISLTRRGRRITRVAR